MEITRRSFLVYGLLLAAWILVLGWQVAEHSRVQRAARDKLRYSAMYTSKTLEIVLGSQRRFGGVISKERLESALAELIRPGELNGVALLNEAGEKVASAGAPVEVQQKAVVRPAELWEDQTVTLMNPVVLGTNLTRELEGTNPPIILSRQDFPTNRPPRPPPEMRTNELGEVTPVSGSNSPPTAGRSRSRGPGDGRPRFGRPFWMSEDEYKSVLQKQGVHSFLIVMSTQSVRATLHQDLWLRSIIAVLATVSVVGSGLAWRNLGKSSDLQIRLVRASELNLHLKELNLAAAGLAHETRNPLNIVRGLAQMISKQDDVSPEIRNKSREIIDETDRVTAQLNEFINYSRPREVRRSVLTLSSVVGELVRTLNHDFDEKNISLEVKVDQFTIEADEQLLRQALFNLLLNAIQAVATNGEIEIVARKNNASDALLEIRDNGPGVPPDRRSEIFKPYFTTNEKGTGLGLAVVQQIVLAHGWEIECLPNEPCGAIFRITHLKLAA
ncbi:MAG: ATP-binding protein [Verrucomicrobia bacterium]|nr:ATP-binding protein [Verrucomicrobiota bacterium]